MSVACQKMQSEHKINVSRARFGYKEFLKLAVLKNQLPAFVIFFSSNIQIHLFCFILNWFLFPNLNV